MSAQTSVYFVSVAFENDKIPSICSGYDVCDDSDEFMRRIILVAMYQNILTRVTEDPEDVHAYNECLKAFRDHYGPRKTYITEEEVTCDELRLRFDRAREIANGQVPPGTIFVFPLEPFAETGETVEVDERKPTDRPDPGRGADVKEKRRILTVKVRERKPKIRVELRAGESVEEMIRRRDEIRRKLAMKQLDKEKRSRRAERELPERESELHAPTENVEEVPMVDARARPHILQRLRRFEDFDTVCRAIHDGRDDWRALKNFEDMCICLLYSVWQRGPYANATWLRGGPKYERLVSLMFSEYLSYVNRRTRPMLIRALERYVTYTCQRPDRDCVLQYALEDAMLVNSDCGVMPRLMEYHDMYADIIRRGGENESNRLTALRILLLIGGVEPNPGPTASKGPLSANKQKRAEKKDRKKKMEMRRREAQVDPDLQRLDMGEVMPLVSPNTKITGPREAQLALKESLVAHYEKEIAEHDAAEAAKSEREGKLEDTIIELQSRLEKSESMKDEMEIEFQNQIRALSQLKDEAIRAGFIADPDEEVRATYSFRGHFTGDSCPTFNRGDPVVCVEIMNTGRWRLTNCGAWSYVYMPRQAVEVAAFCSPCDSREKKFKNIYAGLCSSNSMRKFYETCPDPVLFAVEQNLRAFLLTGIINVAGKLKFLNMVEERVPEKYTCPIPPDWREKCKDYIFAPNFLDLEAKCAKCCRMAPVGVKGLVPHVPLWCDFGTMVAGICKRLEPTLPARRPYMKKCIRDKVAEFEDLVDQFFDAFPDANGEKWNKNIDVLIDSILSKRKKSDRKCMMEGVKMCKENFEQAMVFYGSLRYKAFVKLETYIAGTFKPNRFIMSLDLQGRGIQLYCMAKILLVIEMMTERCNVKHLTSKQITKKLKAKFKHLSRVAETDFSSFESCIGVWMKRNVENHIYRKIASHFDAHYADQCTQFIDNMLDRKTVAVDGPGWRNHRFHHIRMSGDYWTSIGNLITNLIIIAAVNDWSVAHTMEVSLLEGDDGTFPAPETEEEVERLKRRAQDCGVLLKFDIAPWYSLSFCGNHMEMENGELVRHRDPLKTLMNLIILFSPNGGSKSKDVMLQRSKCLSVLDGPWVPGASAFAAVYEFCTRESKVDEQWLLDQGLLKEYTSYGVEGCVPECLARTRSPMEAADVIYEMNNSAGGKCSKRDILSSINTLLSADSDVDLDPLMDISDAMGTVEKRDGLTYSHTYPEGKLSLKKARHSTPFSTCRRTSIFVELQMFNNCYKVHDDDTIARENTDDHEIHSNQHVFITKQPFRWWLVTLIGACVFFLVSWLVFYKMNPEANNIDIEMDYVKYRATEEQAAVLDKMSLTEKSVVLELLKNSAKGIYRTVFG